MYCSGVQSTGAEIRKYLTVDRVSKVCRCELHPRIGPPMGPRPLTVIDLLQSDLRVLWQALLLGIGEHKGFWFLRRRHGRIGL